MDELVDCNKCGKSCAKPENDAQLQCNYGLNNASFTTGYFSDVFEDLNKITFSMCEECLFELFLTFKVMPKMQEVDVHDDVRGENRLLKLVDGKLK
jgi:hypothetical protein